MRRQRAKGWLAWLGIAFLVAGACVSCSAGYEMASHGLAHARGESPHPPPDHGHAHPAP